MRRKGKAKAAAASSGADGTKLMEVNGAEAADDHSSKPPPPEPTIVDEPAVDEQPSEPMISSAPPSPQSSEPLEPGGNEYSITNYLDLGDLFTTPRNASEEERQRIAAAEFQAAIAPAFAGMDGPPPSAATPDEAVRQFTEATGDPLPDPGGNLSDSIYNNETSAYYRIRRQFGKGIGRSAGPWSPPAGLGR